MLENLNQKVRILAVAFLMMFALSSNAFPRQADQKDTQTLAGKWKMVSITPNGDNVDWTLNMKQDSGAWTATVSTPDGDAPAKDLKVNLPSVHMKTPYGGDYYDIDLKLDGQTLKGTWSGGGDTGTTTGTRITDSAAK